MIEIKDEIWEGSWPFAPDYFVPEDAPERLVAWIETFLAAHP